LGLGAWAVWEEAAAARGHGASWLAIEAHGDEMGNRIVQELQAQHARAKGFDCTQQLRALHEDLKKVVPEC
jgi:hypothetical protein